ECAGAGRCYRPPYFDDGTPLGSAQNDECHIDSLGQTWAVMSGAADPERARAGMRAVEERLVRPADGLILLFTPPFDEGNLQPGYIKGYVPGIRENGGQYTHAATWVVQATALLGQGNRAGELFHPLHPHWPGSAPAVAGGGGPLQGRALRRGRRRLRRLAPRRPRRLDVVHRLGLVALPRGPGDHPRLPPRGRPPAPGAVHPHALAG